ncbi:MAG: hypothetical protein V1798_10390 [Pseudomonadota bacterium]
MKIGIVIAAALWALAGPAQALETEEIGKGKGIVTCTGGSQNALFNRECKQVTINRVSTTGGLKYEITCVDSGHTTFVLGCDAFAWEQKTIVF